MDASDLKNLLIKLMRLSISAHNVQPFRLKYTAKNSYEIWVDHERLLTIADPHERDLLVALGALLETFSIGLSKNQLEVSEIEILNLPDSRREKPFCVARFVIETRVSLGEHPLSNQLERRFSYRGKFAQTIAVPAQTKTMQGDLLVFLSSAQDKNKIAGTFDRVNKSFLDRPEYLKELYGWLRFKPTHARWNLDGLNAQAMGLGGIEVAGASVILKPAVYHWLNSMGLAAVLLSEKPIIISSSALVAITGPAKDPVQVGRGFMRGWLQLTALNLYGAPLSLLIDDPGAQQEMRSYFSVNPNESIYNILRVGPLPKSYTMPERARLGAEELYA